MCGSPLDEALHYALDVKARVVSLLDQPLYVLCLVADRRLVGVGHVLLGLLPLLHLQYHRWRIGEAADLAQDDISRPPRLRVCGSAGRHIIGGVGEGGRARWVTEGSERTASYALRAGKRRGGEAPTLGTGAAGYATHRTC